MRSVLLLVTGLLTLQYSSPCPESCTVCSTDAIICTGLSMFEEVPDSAKALMLTDGRIEHLDRIVYSDISNLIIVVLSNNLISTIAKNAFQNLTILRMLSLDRNRISSSSLDETTFSWLPKLETLHLSHNSLKELNGSWFQKTHFLKTLLLDGNLLTRINSNTFASSDLKSLETLDLSDNLIDYVGQDSFRNLPQLSSLDLSRNRLEYMAEVFSYLSQLSMLNLNLNRWNCSCELRELAHFLNRYNQSPNKVLYNGNKLVCASSVNQRVQTVLELTKVNCMLSNRTIKEDIVAKRSITSQHYIRDIVIAIVFSCLGGVVVTLAILAGVHRKFGRKFDRKQQRKKTKEQTIQTLDFSDGKEALSVSYPLQNSNYRGLPPWDKDVTPSKSRPDSMENDFTCQNCRNDPKESWSTYRGSDQWKVAGKCPSMIRDKTQIHDLKDICGLNSDYHRQPAIRHGNSIMRMHQIALRRHISVAQRQMFSPEEQPNIKMSLSKHQHGGHGIFPIHQYHHTCVDTIQDNTSGNQSKGSKNLKLIANRDIIKYNQSNIVHQDVHQASVQKKVTFDLAMERAMFVSRKEGPYKISRTTISKTLGQKGEPSPCKETGKAYRRSTRTRQSEIPTRRSQGERVPKVKLNLNPLKRIQVHPKSSFNHKCRKNKITSKKITKDKSQQSAANIASEGEENLEQSNRDTAKSPCLKGSTNPDESSARNPEESCSQIQTSNLRAESIKPLGTANSLDPRVSTLDLNLAVRSPDAYKSLQKELEMPQKEKDLPNVSTTPVLSTVSVVQEHLSSDDGTPKRKIRLIVPEKTSSRPQTALEKKIR